MLHRFHVVGEALQDGVELTGRFAGLDHVDVDAAEDRRMLGQRGAQVHAAAHVLDDRADAGFETGVFGLFFEDVQTFEHRDAGADHRRELAREDDQAFAADARLAGAVECGPEAFAGAPLGAAASTHFGDREDLEVLAAQAGHDLVARGAFDGLGDAFAPLIPGDVLESRHVRISVQ
ncbi:MAG: hypothetical protein M5U26_27050 [Planctomycetota bacterium]|nr:hypothetical protein [Planctomycetota bacterium]